MKSPFTMLCALAAALILMGSGCSSYTSAHSPAAPADRTAAPLAIPNQVGLPKPQSQPPSVPPTPVPLEPRTSPPAEMLQARENAPSFQREAAPAPQGLSIVGIWVSQEETTYGTVYSQVILERTGTYSMQTWWKDLLAYEVGSYYVGEGFIHFMLDNYEPKIYKGVWMSRPLTWTAWYTVVDANTMVWEDRIVGSRWTVYRQ